MALVFKIKSSVWHQFVKEKLNVLLKNSRIFCCRKNWFKTIGKLKNAGEAASDGMKQG